MARKGVIIAGGAILAGGLVTGVALAAVAAAVQSQTVEGFARAPVGCTTTLEFDTADTFTLFVETTGRVADTGGDCKGSGAEYDRGDDDPPRVELTLLNDGDGQVTLGDANDYSYDTGDFVGASYATADIVAAGTYRLTVVSDDTDFAIAVGRDPERDSAVYLAAGVTLAGLGLLIGLVVLVVGLVQRAPTPPASGPTTPPIMQPITPLGTPAPFGVSSPVPAPPMLPGTALPPPPPPAGAWPVHTPPPPPPAIPPSAPPVPPAG